MKVSRNRSVPVVAALAALGVTVAAVSCTGTSKSGTQPADKTTGPAIAKGDKSVEKPGQPAKAGQPATTAKPTTPAPAAQPTTKAAQPAPAQPAPAQPAPAQPTTKAAQPAPAQATPPAQPPKTTTSTAPVEPPRPGAPLPPPTEPTPAPGAANQPAPPQPAKPAVAPTTKSDMPPVSTQPKKPMTEADKILEQRIKEFQLEHEKRAVLVQTYVANAHDAGEAVKWEECAEWSSKALELDHDNADAQTYLRMARKAQGYRDADVASISELMIQSAKVKREQARFQVQSAWDTAMKDKAAKNYAAALQQLDLALTIIQNDPAGGDWGSREHDIKAAMEEISKLKANADAATRNEAAKEAYRKVKEEEAKRRLAEIEKKNALLKSAMDAFSAEQYEKAEGLLADYCRENPSDSNARQLMNTANRAKHQKISDETIATERERFKQWKLDMEETTIPYHKILTWPSQEHWNRITELRKDSGVISEPVPDSPEAAATKNKLRTDRISFNFTGANFGEVIRFINDAKQLNVVVDPAVAPELESIPISLNLQDVSIETALKTLTKSTANLTYVVQGTVVFITKADSAAARPKPIIQVHSIGDLTVPLTNFVAPDLNLLPSKAEESEDQPKFGKASEGVAPFGGADKVQELVQKNVATEDYWSSEGVSIAPHGEDKLLVIAAPEVQRNVAAFLNDLRAFSGLVVTIETRFLTVTDNFLRDVGVDIRGLGNGSPGQLALLDDVTNGLVNNASAGFDNGGIGLPANASGRPSSGAFYNNNGKGNYDYRARTENIFDQALGTKITNVGGAVIQWTMVDDTNLSMILQAVEKTQEGRVLQAPIVTVYNTQRANITLITQLSFIQDFDVEVAQTAFIADPIVGVIQDGLVLDVQPTVSHDRKYVTMQLKPTIATLQRPIPTFTTSLGAFTTPVTIQIPTLRVEKAATTVRVPDGGTILLGGLKSINMKDLRAVTPWISSVPFASFFLGRQGTVKEMENLMIIVKATISDLNEQEKNFRK
jgi:type II secretory pathway component GspD/PulD (secretin)